jgi:TrmH family RNA methyltransferase
VTLRTLSDKNARVIRLGKLSARRRAREAEAAFVIDGPVLLADALAAGVAVSDVFVDAERLDERTADALDAAEAVGAEVYAVSPEVLRRVTDPVHPQAVAAIAARPVVPAGTLARARSVLGLIGVADPGNAGTLVRSAVAAGFDAVVVTPGTVELFGPKALRASAGALFAVPVVEVDELETLVATLRDASITTVATTLHADVDLDAVDLTGACAVLVGNEAHGLDPDAAAVADVRVRIPMAGPVESLNAAMAGTLVCFEVLRQRRAAEMSAR